MPVPRYADRFTTADGSSIVYTFPLALMEWESNSQPLSQPVAALAGASYDFNQLSSSLAPKRNAIESVRFLLTTGIDAAIDECRSECYRIGLGKLWTLDASAVRRWCWARVSSMPSFMVSNPFTVPVSISFQRFSDWYGATPEDETVTMNESSEAFNVVNDGNARVYNGVFILKGTFVNPVITNTTNGYRMQSSRDGSAAGHWLRFDAGKNRVEFSSDGGTTWAGDLTNFVRKAGQAHLMVIEPGTNAFTITFGGVASGTFDYDFSHAYHS